MHRAIYCKRSASTSHAIAFRGLGAENDCGTFVGHTRRRSSETQTASLASCRHTALKADTFKGSTSRCDLNACAGVFVLFLRSVHVKGASAPRVRACRARRTCDMPGPRPLPPRCSWGIQGRMCGWCGNRTGPAAATLRKIYSKRGACGSTWHSRRTACDVSGTNRKIESTESKSSIHATRRDR